MKKLFNIFIAFLLAIEASLVFISIFIDFESIQKPKEPYFLEEDQSWADTLLKHMSLDEKIGQLFFIELNNENTDNQEKIDSIVVKLNLGGIKFNNTHLISQLILTNFMQSNVKIPLMISSEGSLINQDDISFPMGTLLSAITDSAFVNFYLENYTEVIKLSGTHIDFSNTVSLIDTLNPETGFSDKRLECSKFTSDLRLKLFQKQLISCLDFDDELFLNKDSTAIDTLSKQKADYQIDKFFAIRQNVKIVRAILNKTSLYNYQHYLNRYYNFKGLIFCHIPDTLSENGFSALFNSGTNVFIASKNHEKYISIIKNKIAQKPVTENEINKRVKLILMAKKWLGLDKPTFRSAELSLSKIIKPQRKLISWAVYQNSSSLIKNQGNIIPINKLLSNTTHILCLGNNLPIFHNYLNLYTDADNTLYKKGGKFPANLKNFTNVIVAINQAVDCENDSLFIQALEKLSKTSRIIVVNFGNPSNVKKLEFAQAIIHNFDSHPFAQMISAQAIAGSMEPTGRFKPKYHNFPNKAQYVKINRLQYTTPEGAGFNSEKLKLIDSIIENALLKRATPGCQVLAAKNGKVFYYKAFGYHSYMKRQEVKPLDIYDLASITKVAATTLVAMKLYEKGSVRLYDSIKYMIDDTIHGSIKNHQLRDFFVHQTGLPADMPILNYISYRKPGIGRYDLYYHEKKDTAYSIKVGDNFFLRRDYLDSIKLSLYNLDWDSTKAYCYSDINFNIIYDILLRKIDENYVRFLNRMIYNPLQLRSMGFLPIERFPEKRIAPTQDDKYWRKQLLIGTPHDESAAIYGGISGNAGLFSNANDLAILFQMLLNGGTYGGQKIFEKETVDYFTQPQENTDRGLGFSRKGSYFGHTGFTGCVVWANPETQFIFVFLSNSIHPKVTNKRLSTMKIRSKVLKKILEASSPGLLKLNYNKE